MDCDDSIKKPLLFLDPMCSALSMLADIACSRHYQDSSSSFPSLKIKFHMNSFNTVKDDANVSGSKKPIKFLASSVEAYPSLKFHLHSNKRIMGCDLPSSSKNPMGSASEKGATFKAELHHNDDDDEDLCMKEKKRRALKRKSVAMINDAENDDVLDQDRVMFKPSPNKFVGSSSRKRQRFNVVVEAAPSELPQEFKDKIDELGGNEITLLITKSLFDSDLNEQQNRLSIPSKQIENVNFLREGEVEDLEGGKGIEVKLIQPSLEVTNLTLAKWNMRKKNGRISASYVLRSSSWKRVIKANELKVSDRVQVWSFRIQEELCMAIVKL